MLPTRTRFREREGASPTESNLGWRKRLLPVLSGEENAKVAPQVHGKSYFPCRTSTCCVDGALTCGYNKPKFPLYRAHARPCFLLPDSCPVKKLNRADADVARAVARKLLPDPKTRRRALELLREGIAHAHAIDGASWGATLSPHRIRLNVGRGAVLAIESGAVELKGIGRLEDNLEAPDSWRATVDAAAAEFEGAWFSNPPWRAAHSSGVLELLREEFGDPIPAPDYANTASVAQPSEIFPALQWAIAGERLQIAPRFLASFFTALQLKGFAVTSGPSGTGKTRLATTFAALLNQPGAGEERARLDENFRVNGRLHLPAPAARLLSGESASVTCNAQAFAAKVDGNALVLRGAGRKCVAQTFADGAPIGIESEIDDAGRAGFRLLQLDQSEVPSNHLFLPVRPDWSDGHALLGYFNPLLSRYEWTPFLRFLLRADASFRAGDGVAYFVILDEMNLARAEHYFADLLSVLESGRDSSGRTREPLRFDFEARTSGELPPRELRLPPNLYFVGTLNADETTFTLSPKVLDRAWVLETPPVDFCDYPPPAGEAAPLSLETRAALTNAFTRGGAFTNWGKAEVVHELEAHPRWREDLQNLNLALQEHDAGFGFRAFDEIVIFCALARLQAGFASDEDAFDAAIECKILPRLSGPRARIEAPLEIVLEWARARGLEHSARALERKLKRLEREGWL